MKSIVNPINKNEVINKLNNTKLEHSEFIGIVCCIIHSKEIFPNNKDIIPFLEQVFSVKYLQYVLNSRTLISARLCKTLLCIDGIELEKLRNKTVKYFYIYENKNINSNKKKNANDKLSIWLKEL
ncbi:MULTISPECIES: hypothetical protein [unclassified Clostridium]|uniref:hypothetical protein n=1 Tax=unclassified Clostridium TaxID=2614128 RepID=UPI001C8B4AD6|nr:MULTISPECIES: hypothetical protein [unclassified Clostridium]MBX9136738.1 hypothetical protein [Clostridium sp. K12(2020)]MBX9145163.1 hypothetical protein [Clostridium sp. K13]MDU4326280.1 hypothetical protein [Clostridium celatum]